MTIFNEETFSLKSGLQKGPRMGGYFARTDETQFYVTLQCGDGIPLHLTRYFLECKQNGYRRIRYAC